MLDTETKRRIDSARDILVGRIPDPKAQVEQITIALIYKFMDDMDKEAIEFGGNASFFTNEYEKYGWSKIFDPKLGGFGMLALYSDAILKLNQNPNIPQLFRDIFKNAYLPYRDPETLKLFLKTINDFNYDHSEKLGDAFEYLLSVLGSQGDAGQFRTPRHVIDFVVNILQPKKNETILDPACGTAGFLISSYKHILKENTNKTKGDLLTSDDRKKIMQQFTGYDISPDMVRLSLVNMYLHNFTLPKIYEYDTLTSEDRWGDYFDIIMANPPFMSPTGGIKPHKRFTIQAKRSEALFVDYIAEHINPTTGRAGIIVPEGVIFKSETAFKSLRKMLVDKNYLYAVVSLPAGIFNPYSGVKTSILLLDKTVAKKTKSILFVKIENDGFDLGAQRKAIAKNDLTDALEVINNYQLNIKNDEAIEVLSGNYLLVDKEKIKTNADYNLSIDRYKVNGNLRRTKFETVAIKDVCEIQRGGSPRPIEQYITDSSDGINWIKIGDVGENAKYVYQTAEKIKKEGLSKTRLVYDGDFILSNSMSFGRPYIVKITGAIHDGWLLLRMKDHQRISQDYLYEVLRSAAIKEQYEKFATGGVVRNLNSDLVSRVEIPLPPLSIQQEIVNKIEGWQKIIDGAKQIIENYKPQIDINPDWKMVKLGNIVVETMLGLVKGKTEQSENFSIPYLKMDCITYDGNLLLGKAVFVQATIEELKQYTLRDSDFIYNTRNAPNLVGKSAVYHGKNGKYLFTNNILRIRFDETKATSDFVNIVMNCPYGKQEINKLIDGTTSVAALYQKNYLAIQIPLPPLSIQQQIVNQIEQEQQLINTNKQLIKIFEQKIKDEINKLWQTDAKEYATEDEALSLVAEE